MNAPKAANIAPNGSRMRLISAYRVSEMTAYARPMRKSEPTIVQTSLGSQR
jgi:hypothetical protein